MFYFDKNDPRVHFCDKRKFNTKLCDGRTLTVNPDTICDFKELPFANESFYLVVFDPPHLNTLGENSWMAKKYGTLKGIDWKAEISRGRRMLESFETEWDFDFQVERN